MNSSAKNENLPGIPGTEPSVYFRWKSGAIKFQAFFRYTVNKRKEKKKKN